ncbi:MAG: ATP-binding cassette domain-containing protein [Oscillibacter sp.]|nr:ATP-binding cassette domain-containing protein [Oscillibacter sp.]
MSHLIELKDIYKIYHMGEETVHALDGINLTVDQGEFVAIVGSSGSGKSTAMNIIGCLDVPTSGTYHLGGIDVSTMEDDQQAEIRNKMLGFIFQQYNLIPKLTVQENVELPLLYAGVSAEERRERAIQSLERVGLADKRKNLPSQLSGGQQQRVSIARPWRDPSVILADEPTGALDSRTGREVLRFLQKLNQEGDTVVLITHDNSIAVKAKRIVRLQDGKIIYDGTPVIPRPWSSPRRTRERGAGMNFTQSFKLAIKSLLLSKMRALLTMLGIIIGVAAVIIITSLGNGMQNYMNAQFEQLGSNLIQVMVYGRGEGGTRDVNTEDMYALVEKYPQYLSGVTPYVSATAKVRQGTEDFDRTSIYGVSEAFYRADTQKTMQGSSLENGRFLRYIDVERHQNVCVIGSYLAENAFRTDPLGQTISVSGVPYMVVGVLAESGDSTEGSVDDVIYIPYANAQRLGGGYGDMYLMTSTDRDTASAAKGIIENRLFKTYQSSDYYMVMTSAEMMDAMDSMLNTLMMILILIAAINLLVGGIGIMNIMLVSVTERTREIGIRKSLGAKCRDIRSQFIIEAGTTSAIGGAIGIILGILMANVLTNVIALVLGTGNDGFVAMPTAGGIGVAFGVSVAVGILFGYLPANKAAKLNPIDALRYD